MNLLRDISQLMILTKESAVGGVQEVIDFVNGRPSPFGLYLFSEDQSVTEQILNSTTSGHAAVNDCTLQPIINDLPFGGVGNSGTGKYHGEWGFRGARTTSSVFGEHQSEYTWDNFPKPCLHEPRAYIVQRTGGFILCPGRLHTTDLVGVLEAQLPFCSGFVTQPSDGGARSLTYGE